MRTAIVGPGAMGCLFAGLLAEQSHDVWLLDNDAVRAAAIAESGIRIEQGSESRAVGVNITANPDDIGHVAVVFLFVKAYDTAAAMQHALPLVDSDTTIVSLQNGAGNVEAIERAVARSAIVRGSTAYGSTHLGVGHVRHAGTGSTAIAAVDPSSEDRAVSVAGVLAEAGIEAQIGSNWLELVWHKLVINAAINPLAAVSDVANGRLVEDGGLRAMLVAAATEAGAVALAKGVRMGDPAAEAEAVCLRTSDNIASMLQDVRQQRRTEIDAITGVVVSEARKLGIEAPTNEMLLTRVHKMAEDGASARGGA